MNMKKGFIYSLNENTEKMIKLFAYSGFSVSTESIIAYYVLLLSLLVKIIIKK